MDDRHLAARMNGARADLTATDEHAAERRVSAHRRVRASERSGAPARPRRTRSKFRVGHRRCWSAWPSAAVVIAVAVARRRALHAGAGAKWSSWSPDRRRHARRPGDRRLPRAASTGISAVDQLAVVTVVNLRAPPPRAAAAQAAANDPRARPAAGSRSRCAPSPTPEPVSLLSGNTIAYNLCGIGGKNCAIGVGDAVLDRLLLLRREALELALYTFKYIGGVQNVVAILPPGHTHVSEHAEREPARSRTRSVDHQAGRHRRPVLAPGAAAAAGPAAEQQPARSRSRRPCPRCAREATPEAGLVDRSPRAGCSPSSSRPGSGRQQPDRPGSAAAAVGGDGSSAPRLRLIAGASAATGQARVAREAVGLGRASAGTARTPSRGCCGRAAGGGSGRRGPRGGRQALLRPRSRPCSHCRRQFLQRDHERLVRPPGDLAASATSQVRLLDTQASKRGRRARRRRRRSAEAGSSG